MNLPAALNLVEPLDRQTLGERAYAKLADLLISGRLAPGEKLSLRAAADVLGVSIMPVREAVSRLVADKALEVTPNRAVRVPLLSAAQFRDLARRVRFGAFRHAVPPESENDVIEEACQCLIRRDRESHIGQPDDVVAAFRQIQKKADLVLEVGHQVRVGYSVETVAAAATEQVVAAGRWNLRHLGVE